MRDGEAEQGDRRRRVVRRLAAANGGDHARGDAEYGSDQDRQPSELERQGDPRDDRLRDRQSTLISAEVALEGEPGPTYVLHWDWLIEPVLLPDRGQDLRIAVLGSVRERRVTRDRAHADEDEHAGQEDDDQGGPGLAQDEDAHDRRQCRLVQLTCTRRSRPGSGRRRTAGHLSRWRSPRGGLRRGRGRSAAAPTG